MKYNLTNRQKSFSRIIVNTDNSSSVAISDLVYWYIRDFNSNGAVSAKSSFKAVRRKKSSSWPVIISAGPTLLKEQIISSF